ncbi:protein-arginine deiminase family protein [Actinomadura kijaniata]|uniref:protein-arginine deiminase family protein n=1 Tax=Actinomadura kijaniata TaxID=46161 RepID=UPI0014718E18|nr:protein-arginine deiminase family protein [Actinomadura kijaniata]
MAASVAVAVTGGMGTIILAFRGSGDGVRIVADVDRDGSVDDHHAPQSGRTVATHGGALVLPNIGVTGGRCPDSRRVVSGNELEGCHDASDDIAHAPQNLAPVKILPLARASGQARAAVTVHGDPMGRIRLFRRTGQAWTYLKPGARIGAEDLRSGVELGVDARDIVRDRAVWDGRFTVEAQVTDGDRSSSSSVPMTVAPLILHNHTERVSTLLVPRSAGRDDHQRFVRDLRAAAARTGGVPVRTLSTDDNWAQDIVEFGYVSMPGPGGTTRSIEIAVRSPRPTRAGGRAVFDLRGPGFGAVQSGGKGYHQVNFFGNLEVIPPHEHRGRSFPVGRIIYGDGGPGAGFDRQALTLFTAQGLQEPLKLDTSWLAVAHVDEFVQFLPADNPRGWTIAVADPRAGVDLLRAVNDSGHGRVRASSHRHAPATTVGRLLANRRFLDGNTEVAAAIDRNLKILMDETGVRRNEVIAVPALFHKFDRTRPGKVPPDQDAPVTGALKPQGSFVAYLPDAVNGIVLDRRRYLAPRQWGPVVGGRDVFQDAIERAYRKVGMEVDHIDDYTTHHSMGGEIHCGTNAVRTVTKPWWRK